MESEIISENSYIYGIKIENEIVYIGKTSRPIAKRVYEHEFLNKHNEELEKAMKENNYEFVLLYESHNVISDRDLCQIEKALIENIKPKYNICGVSMPYEFYKKKEKNNVNKIDKISFLRKRFILNNELLLNDYIYDREELVEEMTKRLNDSEDSVKRYITKFFGKINNNSFEYIGTLGLQLRFNKEVEVYYFKDKDSYIKSLKQFFVDLGYSDNIIQSFKDYISCREKEYNVDIELLDGDNVINFSMVYGEELFSIGRLVYLSQMENFSVKDCLIIPHIYEGEQEVIVDKIEDSKNIIYWLKDNFDLPIYMNYFFLFSATCN